MEATPEQSAEGLAIVRVLAAVLDRLVCANAPIALADPGQVTKFHAMKAPAIGIQQYLERIHKYSSCSNECFILALIYIDRLIQRNNFLLTELNVHRVVITSILLAAKFFDDAYYNNAYYAKVGGVLVSEMNGLEVDFLFRINFSLHVTPDVFHKYRAELLSQATSAGIRISSPIPAPVPMHVHQEVHHVPVVHHQQSPSAMQYQHHAALVQTSYNHNHHHMNVNESSLPNITPSPPMEAGRLMDDVMQFVHQNQVAMAELACAPLPVEFFVHRSYSEPVKSSYYVPQTSVRCSQNQSYSAPITGMPLQYPGEERFIVMDHHIYPIQGALVHHQHGDFGQHTAVDPTDFIGAQHLVSARLLAGMSGAGM